MKKDLKRIFAGVLFFAFVFTLVSIPVDIYYHGRLMHPEPEKKGWTCRCDFRVFWTAGYKLINYAFPDLAGFYPRGAEYQKKLEEYVGPDRRCVYDRGEPFYHFRYSPVTAFLMIPFAMISYPADALTVWLILLSVTLAAALFLLAARLSSDFNLSPIARAVVLWSAFIVSLRFYLMNLAVGQSDVIAALFFVLFLAAYVRDDEVMAGIIFAVIFQFKPFFAPAALYFMLIGKRKLVLSAFLGIIALFFAPALFIGPDKAVALLKGWAGVLNMSVPSQVLNHKNQSLIYFMARPLMNIDAIKSVLSADRLFYMLSAGATILTYAVLLGFRKAVRSPDDKRFRYLEVSLLIITGLVFSPITWVAHFIYLIIPAAVTALFVMKSRNRGRLYAALGGFFALSVILGTDITKFLPGMDKLHAANIALGALFLAYALIDSYLGASGAVSVRKEDVNVMPPAAADKNI